MVTVYNRNMSHQDQNGDGGGYPPHRENPSQYPPPPGEEDDRPIAYHQRAPSSSSITLPSISSHYDAQPPYQAPGYPQDPRHDPRHDPRQDPRGPPAGYAPDPRGPPNSYSTDPHGRYALDTQQRGPNGYAPDPRGYAAESHGQQPGPPEPHRHQHHAGPPPPNGGPYGSGPPPSAGPYSAGYQHPIPFNQSAPRQRTAIACRYCRRRKIRCSGFDQNPEGRCINCIRFQQECIFTPVSSQAQAFVPAHAVYPSLRPGGAYSSDGRPSSQIMGNSAYPQQLYGAHGQPLGPATMSHQGGRSNPAPYPGPNNPQPYQNAGPGNGGHYPNHGGGPGNPYPNHSGPGSAGPVYPSPGQQTGSPYSDAQPSPTSSYSSYPDDRARSQENSRKRPQQESHASILPPPMPQPSYLQADGRRPNAQDELRLPPVTPTSGAQQMSYSPASTTSSHSTLQPHHAQPGISSRTPPPSEGSRADPMSLNNIMGTAARTGPDDKGMLGRLNSGRKD